MCAIQVGRSYTTMSTEFSKFLPPCGGARIIEPVPRARRAAMSGWATLCHRLICAPVQTYGMPTRGFVSNLDLNTADPSASIPFYEMLLTALGFEGTGMEEPERASWRLVADNGAHFEIEVRPLRGETLSSRHRRNDPVIDHLAFHAESPADVDSIFERLTECGYVVEEPPRLYDYSPGYCAVSFDDPDGINSRSYSIRPRTRSSQNDANRQQGADA